MQVTAFRYQDLFQLGPEHASAQTSIGFVCSAVATIFTQLLIVGRMRLSPATQIAIGLIAGASAFFLMALPDQLWQMHALFVLFGVSVGMMTTGFNTAVTLAVARDELGAASGLAAGDSGWWLCGRSSAFGAVISDKSRVTFPAFCIITRTVLCLGGDALEKYT